MTNDNLVELLRAGALPCEYVEGEWCLPSEAEPVAIVTYTDEPSPETGHVGWCWWALGRMGDAPSYEEAKARAEEVVRRVMDGPSCTRSEPEADR